MKHIEKIHNVITGEIEIIERDYTDEELAKIEEAKKQLKIEQAQIEAKEAARQAILDRLGLTADEAKLILG